MLIKKLGCIRSHRELGYHDSFTANELQRWFLTNFTKSIGQIICTYARSRNGNHNRKGE